MHRDLKPKNFLFANKKETAALKAIDFGLSLFFKAGDLFKEIVGSPWYMAPEVLKRSYGPEVDTFEDLRGYTKATGIKPEKVKKIKVCTSYKCSTPGPKMA